MTGQGEGKLQLPGALCGVLRRAVELQGNYILVHDSVCARIVAISSLMQYALKALRELSSMGDSPLLFLNVRTRSADSFAIALRNSRLRDSQISPQPNLGNIRAGRFDNFPLGDHGKLKFVQPTFIRKPIFNYAKEELL